MAVQLSTYPPVTIASGGTAVPLSATPTYVTSVTIQAAFTNVSKLSLGDSTVTSARGIEIPPGDTATIDGPVGRFGIEEFLISTVYVVSATTNDSCRVLSFKSAI